MNVEIGTEATQFLFWEYINGIFVTVRREGRGFGSQARGQIPTMKGSIKTYLFSVS
jgi:hypothetical protein